MIRIAALSSLTTTFFMLAACGGSGGVLAEAKTHHDAACACADAQCVKEHIKWFNRLSASSDGEAQLAVLSDEQRAEFKKLSLAAGDCQIKLNAAK